MNIFRFVYKLAYYDELDQTLITKFGILQAASLKDAMSRLYYWYGEDTIDMIEIHVYDEDMINITQEAFNAMVGTGGSYEFN